MENFDGHKLSKLPCKSYLFSVKGISIHVGEELCFILVLFMQLLISLQFLRGLVPLTCSLDLVQIAVEGEADKCKLYLKAVNVG